MTSWLQKLGLGLKKSSSRLSSGISDIFTKRKIDDATLEELEELLITSDMGVKASSKIVDSLSRVRVDKSGEPEEIRTRITDVVSNILKPCEKDFAIEGSPCVILMVGVNGAGKPPQSENSLPDLEEKDFLHRRRHFPRRSRRTAFGLGRAQQHPRHQGRSRM